MWCGSLRPVSVAPHGCQIARGKVIYTTDTVVSVVVAAAGRETPRCLQEKQPVSPWQSYILYGWWQLGCKTFIGCRAALHKMPFLSFAVCHLCRAATYQLGFFPPRLSRLNASNFQFCSPLTCLPSIILTHTQQLFTQKQ